MSARASLRALPSLLLLFKPGAAPVRTVWRVVTGAVNHQDIITKMLDILGTTLPKLLSLGWMKTQLGGDEVSILARGLYGGVLQVRGSSKQGSNHEAGTPCLQGLFAGRMIIMISGVMLQGKRSQVRDHASSSVCLQILIPAFDHGL